ncbi:MAG: ABC transporter ATP-binding protein [Chloroflexota bacterium]|nr:ABC transporter ATP-binding protein [Chloroflexota bacterium]MDQ6907409.1 ABC transporter ATP-binding protein [Chloroflexota bacterium]
MAERATIQQSDTPSMPVMAPERRAGGQPVKRPHNAEQAVSFDNVSKKFGKEEVLHGITFRVPWGEILGVIGPSGSGKTTMIRMMLGMYKPSGGAVRLFGRDPWKLRRGDRERIGYMPQDFVLYPALTVEENMRFAASLYGVPWWETHRRIDTLLPYVDLVEARKRRAADLSGGMRRRLSLAATMMHDPDFLVLDEPTAGIDPILRTSIWDGLRSARDEGKTMVVTTQYVTEAEYCDQVLLVHEGAIIASGTPSDLRRAATGGDMLDIRFDRPRPDIVIRLQALPFVHEVEPLDRPEEVRVTVDNLSEDLPLLSEYCDREEGGCIAMEPHVLTFDDVFVRLVSEARDAGQDTNDGNPRPPASPPVAA